jgi:hypothetical protein
MADVQHSALTDPELHEPKGASTATAGQVYVANGSGSGTWKKVTAAELDATSDPTFDDVTVDTLTANSISVSGAATLGSITSPITIGGVTISAGTGTPEGAVTANVGSIFLRTDNANAFYVKQTGTGNTGWVLK